MHCNNCITSESVHQNINASLTTMHLWLNEKILEIIHFSLLVSDDGCVSDSCILFNDFMRIICCIFLVRLVLFFNLQVRNCIW